MTRWKFVLWLVVNYNKTLTHQPIVHSVFIWVRLIGLSPKIIKNSSSQLESLKSFREYCSCNDVRKSIKCHNNKWWFKWINLWCSEKCSMNFIWIKCWHLLPRDFLLFFRISIAKLYYKVANIVAEWNIGAGLIFSTPCPIV